MAKASGREKGSGRVRKTQSLVELGSESSTRRRLYDLVVERPGLSISEIAAGAGVQRGTAAYHLSRLSRADRVVSMREGSRLHYYENGGSFRPAERLLLPVLSHAGTARVLLAIVRSPGIHRSALARALCVSRPTIDWHVRRLFSCRLVRERRGVRVRPLLVEPSGLLAVANLRARARGGRRFAEAADRLLAAEPGPPPAYGITKHFLYAESHETPEARSLVRAKNGGEDER